MLQIVTDRIFEIGTLAREQKQTLIGRIEAALRGYGFVRVTKRFDGERKSSMSIRFERQTDQATFAWIEILFDKYGGRCFQVLMESNETEPPYNALQSGNLVRRQSQYYHWWGARWWTLFRNSAWSRDAGFVERCVPQITTYLDGHGAGPNIRDQDW